MVASSEAISGARGSHAIVIGGSMTGLVTARVLSDHFDSVTIVDRDHFPEGPEVRNGVPQARHIHVLLVKGRQLLEQLYPGLDADLIRGGVKPLEWGYDTVSLGVAGWTPRFHTNLVSYTVSRAYLEWAVHCRTIANTKVRVMENTDVTELVADADKTHVTGVKVKFRRGADQEGEDMLTADLVVDATGRRSHAPEWLKGLGYEAPQETIIDSLLGYATGLFEPPPHAKPDWGLMFIFARPPKLPRGGGISVLENGMWIATVAGAARDYPPTDEAGFRQFASTLATPLFSDALKDAKLISPIYGYQQTANQLRYYERLARWPENFIVTGDAVCAFNPIYGQGMTIAAQDALLLDRCLLEIRQSNGNRAGMARRFQKMLAKSNQTPWLLATGEDMRYPTTEGGKPGAITRLTHRYLDRVIDILPDDVEASRTFLEVLHLVEPPSVLFRPHILGQITRRAFQKARAKEVVTSQPYPVRAS